MRAAPRILSLLGLVFLVGIVFFLGHALDVRDVERAPSGTLYLSLVKEPYLTNNWNSYRLDVERRTLAPIFPWDADVEYFGAALSPSGDRLAFSMIDLDDLTRVRLFVGDAAGLRAVEITDAPENVTRRQPVWSPDGGHIAYTTKDDDLGSETDLSRWNVYVYSFAAGKSFKVADGSNPRFAPDGSLIMLRSGGIYRYTTASGSTDPGTLLLSIPNAGSDYKIDVAKDGSHIAWTDPRTDTVRTYAVSNWEPFEADAAWTVPARAFWPIFSPDGRYLAYEEIDAWEGEGEMNQRITILDLQSGVTTTLRSLSGFAQDFLYLADWR